MFGNPKDFAIEAEADRLPDAPRSTVWGHMRIWCCGESMGDFGETHSGLSEAHDLLMQLASDLSQLESPLLVGLSDAEIWTLVNSALYGDHPRSRDEIIRASNAWRRFVFLTNWGEPFDRYSGVIFRRDPDHIGILVRGVGDAVSAFSVTAFGFKRAVSGFDEWHQAELAAV